MGKQCPSDVALLGSTSSSIKEEEEWTVITPEKAAGESLKAGED